MGKGRIVHGASLTQFLTFCNRLSSRRFRFGRLNPKSNSLFGAAVAGLIAETIVRLLTRLALNTRA
jgi:hypothetical protein